MAHTVHNAEVTEKLLSGLLSTIQNNNEITNKQNIILSRSTKWLVRLTIAIVVLTTAMIGLMIFQYNYKQPSFIVSPKQYSTTPLEPTQTKVDNNTKGAKKNTIEQTKP